MFEAKEQNDSCVLRADVGPDDIIYIVLGGKITNKHFDDFVRWAQRVKDLIEEMYEKNNNQVLLISDVSGVTHFESQPVRPLRELLAHNKQYPVRSAIVGAKDFTRTLLDALIVLTDRHDIQQFKTNEEARMWLKSIAST